jgi:hypothetical protein
MSKRLGKTFKYLKKKLEHHEALEKALEIAVEQVEALSVLT